MIVLPWGAGAQRLRTLVEARARVFPSVGAGVIALRQDSAGRYYILAQPGTSISIYEADGTLVGRIPKAASRAIRYAADFDLTPGGLIAVADRGANAIEVFRPDGSLVSRVSVVAPTSVVALSDAEFAVTTLTSKRLVEVINQRGEVLRSFGDPGDAAANADHQTLHDFGTISGDSSGDIYFAFASLPNPTLRKYDRYGYLAYQSSIPKSEFGGGVLKPLDRVQLLFGLSDFSFSHQAGGWLSIGSSKDLSFGGDVGTGFGESLRRGVGFGQAIQQQAQFSGGPLAATVSGQVNSQGTTLRLGMGHGGGPGRRGGPMAFGQQEGDQANQGAVLQFSDSNNNSADAAGSPGFDDVSGASGSSGTTAELGMFGSGGSESADSGGFDASNQFAPPAGGLGSSPADLPAPFLLGSTMDSLYFRPRGLSDTVTGGPPATGTGNGFGRGRPGGSGAGAGPGGGSQSGHFGRFGAGSIAFTAALRINLGDLGRASADEKPEITAVAADPQTHEIWAAIGDTVVHFSRDGNPIGIYYLTVAGTGSLKPTALLVEPDRLLVAADPWGIYEFARPDKPSAPQEQFNVVPQVAHQPR